MDKIKNVYIMRVALLDIRPPIWRKMRLPGNATLSDLSDSILVAMGWDNDHLHGYNIRGETFKGIPFDDIDLDGDKDDSLYTLDSFEFSVKEHFLYVYDFGDNWRHKITIQKILPANEVENPEAIVCLGGKRAGPPEDCGGFIGYYDILEIVEKLAAKPDEKLSADDEEYYGWLRDYKPDYFDAREVNKKLGKVF
jgi:hypothetical protein